MVHQDLHGLDHEDHPDVNISSPSNGQGIVYDSATSKWKNATVGGGAGAGSPRCSVYRTAVQSIPNDTWTTVSWTGEKWDADNMHSGGAPTRITIPAGQGGLYLIIFKSQWAPNTSGRRTALVTKNETTDIIYGCAQPTDSGNQTSNFIHACEELSAGDYVEGKVHQTSGGSLNLMKDPMYTFMQVVKIGP